MSDSRSDPNPPDLNATFDWPLRAEIKACSESQIRLACVWRLLVQQREAIVALWILGSLLWLSVAVAPLVSDDRLQPDAHARMASPSWQHPLGTDHLGRDTLSCVISGSYIALTLCLVALLMAAMVGGCLVSPVGRGNRWVERYLTGMMDERCYVPALALAIGLMLLMGFGFRHVMIAMAMGCTAPFALVWRRGLPAPREALWIHERSRVARLRDRWYRMLVPILLHIALCTIAALITELGVRASGFDSTRLALSWGSIVHAGWPLMGPAPWIFVFPAMATCITMIGLYLLRSGLSRVLAYVCGAELAPLPARPVRRHP